MKKLYNINLSLEEIIELNMIFILYAKERRCMSRIGLISSEHALTEIRKSNRLMSKLIAHL